MKYIECSTMENKNIPFELSDYVLRKYFTETGQRQGWQNDKKIIAAVSGGGDSISLLWLCKNFYHGHVIAVHVNHGIRGSESDEDENFTREFSECLNVEFHARKIDVPNDRMKGESIESSARRLRLRELCIMSKELKADSILTGHNRDDLAETVLFNILRGTGIRGSVGMNESSIIEGIKFYRPLLGLRREFLRDILRVRNISWREDRTNNDDSYTRNFIRLNLLPLISERINASSVEHLARFGEEMRALRLHEDKMSVELLNQCIESEQPLTLNRKKMKTLDDESIALVIRETGRRLSLRTLSHKRCFELAGLIRKTENFIFQWSGDMTVKSMKGRIYFDDCKTHNGMTADDDRRTHNLKTDGMNDRL